MKDKNQLKKQGIQREEINKMTLQEKYKKLNLDTSLIGLNKNNLFYGGVFFMDDKANIVGIITKVNKLWWIKINRKIVRKSPLDGATFPYLVKLKYKINDTIYEKNKIVYWENENINIGDKVIVTFTEKKPSKILEIRKKND